MKPQLRTAEPYIIGPGETLDRIVQGTVYDYGACGTTKQAHQRSVGILPAGVWAFRRKGDVTYGPRIYLDAPTIERGVLLCAPAGVGKTHLLVKWALAARKHGYSVFIVDVKGNLLKNYPQLDPGDGSLFHFSTDLDADSDRINFLAGLGWVAPSPKRGVDYDDLKEREFSRIDESVGDISRMLLEEPKIQDDELRFYENRLNWLHAFIHLLKLQEFYFPNDFARNGTLRSADLSDLFDLVRNEQGFLALARRLLVEEQRREKDPRCPPVRFGVQHNLYALGPLIRRDAESPLDQFSQQTSNENFGLLTLGIVNALKPFSVRLRARVSDVGSGSLFRIEQAFSGSKPCSIVFSAVPETDSAAKALLSIAVRRLRQLVNARLKADERKVPMLLLLDETVMIRGFDPDQYVAFNRQAQAGCVLVYQDLSAIGSDDKALRVLRNVGAQVYMGSLSGKTLQLFQQSLGKRRRTRASTGASHSVDGRSSSETWIDEEVDKLGAAELADLPGGVRPGVVVIRTPEGQSVPPVIVDFDDSAVATKE